MSRKAAWAGIRLVPLPHESSFSALLRFGWQNVLDARTMKQLLNGKRLSLHGDSFLNLTWLHQPGSQTIANWNLPTPCESELNETMKNFGSMFFSKRLKVCPLCFGAGFHSIWHQLTLLEYCPIHACKLIQNCQECDSIFGEYRFSAELFKVPYHCFTCKAPMVGVETDLEAILSQRAEIVCDNSFHGIEKWCKSACHELFILRAILDSSSFALKDSHYKRSTFAIDIAHALHPFPREFSGPTYTPQLTLLSWNIRSRIAEETDYMENRREITKANVNRAMAKAIYKIVVAKIQLWLGTFLSQSTLEKAFDDFLSTKYAKIESLDSAAIAFILFRNCFELSPNWSSSKNFRPNNFRFDHSPPFKLYPYNEREPRLAYYAMYFGIYAGLYWSVERARARRQLSEIRITDLDSLLTKFLLQSEQRVAGGVTFRTIPGMPLPRTLLCTFEIAKISLNSGNGFRSVDGRFG